MDKVQAQSSSKKIQSEIMSLSPNNIIDLYEIDGSDMGVDLGVFNSYDLTNNPNLGIFRFHNSTKLFKSSIFWRGNEFIAAPISVSDFEIKSNGTLPRPKISIAVNDTGVAELNRLKQRIFQFGGDLVGAKFTRYRTFAKYLDARNYLDSILPITAEPDSFAEFPREIYYFDRKAQDDKTTLQYELASLFDVNGIKLPGRIVVANTCPAQYRGNGCNYEYSVRRVVSTHGAASDCSLPAEAPAVATERDEKIEEILGTVITDRGQYNKGFPYRKGDSIYILKGGNKYYFVSRIDNPTLDPPNRQHWISDICSRSVSGCKLRWGADGSVVVGTSGLRKGYLPYNGFPAANKLSQ